MTVRVDTTSGPIGGTVEDGVTVFRGVPYAAAPVGQNRFAAPQPTTPWSAVRDATRPGPAAPQGSSMLAPVLGEEPVTADEAGCLNLTIFSPDIRSSRPALLWLHGGAFVTGYGGGRRQSAARLAARHGIVVVVPNYRLGPLGYLYLGEGGGNMGLLDQIAALQWVHQNASAFGADSERITVAGHSSGALSAAAVAVSPLAEGMARRVAMASPQLGSLTTPEAATVEAQLFTERLGSDLRTASAEQLVKTAEQLAAARGPAAVPPSLVVGGAGLPRDISVALRDCELDLLVGTTRDEARAFLLCDPGARAIERGMAEGMLSQRLPGRGREAYEHYARRRPGAAAPEVAADALTDVLFRMPVLRLASSREAFVYQFDWQPGSAFGACHTVDLPFTFANPSAWGDSPLLAGVDTARLQPLADSFSGALAEFVRSGSAPWPSYDGDRRWTMCFGDVLGTVPDPAVHERELWKVS